MTNAYRGANHHTDMAAKYTKLGHLEEMLYVISQDSHWSVDIKIRGHTAEFVSGRDVDFDRVIKEVLEQLIDDQRKNIVETSMVVI